MQTPCWFCAPDRFRINAELDLPAFEVLPKSGRGLFLTPDVAPIASGHALIVSQDHVHGSARAGDTLLSEIGSVMRDARSAIRRKTGRSTIFFEHCAREETRGCVDHLHVHCLPCDDVLIAHLVEDLGKSVDVFWRGDDLAAALSFVKGLGVEGPPYLFLSDVTAENVILTGDQIPSQYFRRFFRRRGIGAADTWQNSCQSKDSARNFSDAAAWLSCLDTRSSASFPPQSEFRPDGRTMTIKAPTV